MPAEGAAQIRPSDESHPLYGPALLHHLYVAELEAYAAGLIERADLAARLCDDIDADEAEPQP